jgi:hypothetical protein
MCFGSSDKEEEWYGYIEDGKGWTVRPRSEYEQTPAYNSKLHNQYKRERRKYGKAAVPDSALRSKWVTPENGGPR